MTEKQSIKSKGGKRIGAGRKPGVPNKLSCTVKDNIISVFDGIGGVAAMTEWAIGNQTQFFNLYAKLLPLQVSGDPLNPIQVISKFDTSSLTDDQLRAIGTIKINS